MSETWAGETRRFKERVKIQSGADVKADVVEVARQIIQSLPREFPLGTVTAGLMLAGIAMNEFGVTAARMLDVGDNEQVEP